MTDRYTKAVLTVIATCLVILVLQGPPIGRSATAQSGPVHVIVDSVASFALQYAGPLRVRN
jgi:hypothetical protein